ncbi:MAG: hypothetical protein ACLPUO_29075 [Streptosporangiaceae bacterium]|jgi:hypothetical protein
MMAKIRAAIRGSCGKAKIVLSDQRRENDKRHSAADLIVPMTSRSSPAAGLSESAISDQIVREMSHLERADEAPGAVLNLRVFPVTGLVGLLAC